MVQEKKASINAGDFRLDLSYSANSPDSYVITGFTFIDNKTEQEIKPSSPRGRLLNLEGIYPKLEDTPLPEPVKQMAVARLHEIDRSSDISRNDIFFENYRLTAIGTQSRFNPLKTTFAYVQCINTSTGKETELNKLPQPVLVGLYQAALKVEDPALKVYLTGQLKQNITSMKKMQEY